MFIRMTIIANENEKHSNKTKSKNKCEFLKDARENKNFLRITYEMVCDKSNKTVIVNRSDDDKNVTDLNEQTTYTQD